MFRTHLTRGLAFLLTLCMILGMAPMQAIAVDLHPGDTVTTPDKNPPAPVEGAVWVLTDSIECKKIVHTHDEKCFYQSCDHNDGHLSSCYSESTDYAICEHEDETQHTGSVTLTDVVTIDGTNVAWKTEHPAYPAVYAVYKAAYDETYASTKLSFLKETAAKAAGVAALLGKTFCYTTSASATPDKCTHGECSDFTGACYSKLCLLEEHTHVEACYQYTWTLKADLNKNGIADDADQYYVVKYVSDGEVVYEQAVLVGMPTPTIANPSKAADKQYTYQFVGWNTAIADTVTEDVTYTAVYANTVNKYNVLWLDEDGTELEYDKDVEYGKMPEYNGKQPTKAGDNTVNYTFAGWNPTVDVVTGDVTYTATYTQQDVFAVEFIIDGEVRRTEYVVDGANVAAYIPERAHYQLTVWMNGDEQYNFSDAVTGPLKLTASWVLVESMVNVNASNATCTFKDVYSVGEEVVITATPAEGYAVSQVLVNGVAASLTHDNGVATVKFVASEEVYNVDVQTKRVKMELNAAEMDVFGDLSADSIFNAVYNKTESYPVLKSADVTVEYLAYSIELLSKTYEWWVVPGTDVSLEAFLNQYGLGALASYIPANVLPHQFGAQSTERVRVSYAGNDKYCAVAAETTVALVDMRTPVEIVLNQKVNVTYGATAEEILNLVFQSVKAGNTVVTKDVQNVSIKMDSLNAGTRKATVTFAGDNQYAAAVAEVEVVISKAAGKLDIESYTGKFGAEVNASDLFTSNANRIEMVMGLYMGDNVSADAGTVIYVNLPALIDVSAIESESIRQLAEKAIAGVNEKLSGTMTVEELREALETALPYVETLEDFGYEININSNTISMLVAALNEMSNLEGVGSISLSVSIDKDIVLKDAGAYLLAGITADSNYTTAVNGGYVVITPDGYRAELGWNVEDENGIITLEALRNEYDMGASAISVNEGNLKDATAHVYTVFFGVNKNGELVLTQNAKELDIGAYAQVAFLADMGNTMYYAEPIARAFVVAADIMNVEFVDQNGNINNDRVFDFGADATMNAIAMDRNGNIKNGTMTYLYAGMQANGEFYRGTVAPTRPGAYTVIALFIGEDEMNVGAGVGALVINPIEPGFNAADKTVQYDGNEHKVDLQDDAAMHKAYLVVDQNGNLNLVLPEVMTELLAGPAATLNEVLAQLEKINLEELSAKMPAELVEYYNNYVSAVKMQLEELKQEYGVNAVSINGAFPSEIGMYEFYIIGFKNLEYQLGMAHATLTIKCEHVYDHDCDADCNICGDTREVELHKETYIDRYESTCVKQGYEKIRCKACHEVLSEKALPLSEEHVYYNGACLLCQAKEHCEHNYEIVKELAPTCVEPGYVWTVCSECGAEKNYEVGEATGVHGDTYIDRFESTCVKHGYEKTRCKVCHEVMSEIELPLSTEHVFYEGVCLLCGIDQYCKHDYVTVKELEPTCGEAGYVWTKCSKCDAEKNYEVGEPTGKHTFDNDCDAKCNGCELTREVPDHVYTNACDADCNVCGTIRTPSAHVYDHACDTDCNVCGTTREVPDHQYVGSETKAPECGAAGEKTYTCTECGHSYTEPVAATGDHTYDNKCDAQCNNCEHTREVGEHVYANACDDDCNECGHKRTPAEHEYDNGCDADCNVCGEERTPENHKYSNACDKTCDICGAEREVGEHVYENACDKDCNECGAERTPAEHIYDDEYDADCNVCGATREVPEKPAPECKHEYDNDCDASCNKCGENREVGEHKYDDEYDADCNICGHTREVPENPGEDIPEPPQTGDNSNLWLWLILLIASAAGICVTIFGRKRYSGKY